MKKLRLHATLPRTRALGPFIRFAIWVQGCPRKCPGCMTPDAQPLDGGMLVEIASLADQIINEPKIEGITISGGEPFLQAGALARLIDMVREKRDIGVIVYTGYTFKELHELESSGIDTNLGGLVAKTDILIDGRYIQELDDGISLRGSSNQKIIRLTDRYSNVFDQYYGRPERNVEIQLFHNEVFLAGIPGAETLAKWKERRLVL